MSSPSSISDSGRFSGQKMTFSHTCNLLSQYVKEKRSLSLSSPSVAPHGAAAVADGYHVNNRATMNLFPLSGAPAEDSNRCVGHSVNLFPQIPVFSRSALPNPALGKRGSPEPPAGQMTIFYGGQVMVFNDLTAERAKEVMDLASNFESSLKKSKVEAPASPWPSPCPSPSPSPNPKPNHALNLKPADVATSFGSAVTQNVATSFGSAVISAPTLPHPPVASASDLPIARKASLHRFLEKRKDRLVGKAPDVLNAAPSKPVEGKSWLGLARCQYIRLSSSPNSLNK